MTTPPTPDARLVQDAIAGMLTHQSGLALRRAVGWRGLRAGPLNLERNGALQMLSKFLLKGFRRRTVCTAVQNRIRKFFKPALGRGIHLEFYLVFTNADKGNPYANPDENTPRSKTKRQLHAEYMEGR